jgi:hypothetical protein
MGNDGKRTEITGMILISSVDPHQYGLYSSRKKKLIFFRTDESVSWVRAIFSDTMILTEKDKREHEHTQEFEKLIRAVHNPEALGIQIHTSLPIGVGRVMIPDTFDRVEFSICFEYGTELFVQGSTKNLIKSKDGHWIERNLDHEKRIVEMF